VDADVPRENSVGRRAGGIVVNGDPWLLQASATSGSDIPKTAHEVKALVFDQEIE